MWLSGRFAPNHKTIANFCKEPVMPACTAMSVRSKAVIPQTTMPLFENTR
jgi:hypothetical protein